MTDPGDPDGPGSVRVREATPRERPDVLNVLDGGGLVTDAGRIRRALDRGDVLVAVAGDTVGSKPVSSIGTPMCRTSSHNHSRQYEDGGSDGGPDGPVLGALVLDAEEVTALAVRRRRRDQGIGTALVDAAAERRDRLVAEFDPRVRPFWESLGFDISAVEGSGRYRGVRSTGVTTPG